MKKIDFSAFNLAKYICDHIVGENHTAAHRFFVGGLIMFIGVSISYTGSHYSNMAVHISTDLIGYLVHGIGGIPIIETIVNSKR